MHPTSSDLHDLLFSYICFLRAIDGWFHGAHHLVKGSTFAGDHASLYERVYLETHEQIDPATEKAIGLCCAVVGCPIHLACGAAQIMSCYPSPASSDATTVAAAGLSLQRDFLAFVKSMHEKLSTSGDMSLGLENMLAEHADVHEGHVYLLQQRVMDCIDPDVDV